MRMMRKYRGGKAPVIDLRRGFPEWMDLLGAPGAQERPAALEATNPPSEPEMAGESLSEAQRLIHQLERVLTKIDELIEHIHKTEHDIAIPEESVQRALRSQFAADEAPITPQPPEVGDRIQWSTRTDDGRIPTPHEVDAVLRSGVCDNTDLVGCVVLYETDGRDGKRYTLPGIINSVQRSHPDLPLLRAAQEGETIDNHQGSTGHMFSSSPGVVCVNDDGYWIGDNLVPIALDGTVHLHVLTPGPKLAYVEFSVPHDPTGSTQRSWRHHPDNIPF